MITKLTKDQENLLQETLEKWLAIGRSTAPVDDFAVKNIIAKFYKRIGKPEPKFIKFSSPLMCEIFINLAKSQLGSDLRSQLGLQLESQPWLQLGSDLWLQLESQLESQLWLQLESQLGLQLWLQLESQLGSQLWLELWLKFRSELELQLGSELWSELELQLGSELWLKFRSELGSDFKSQLGSQLRSQLRSQLWSELWLKFRSELGSDFKSQLGSQLRSQLRSQLWLELWLKFRSELGSELGSELESKLMEKLKIHQHFAGSLLCSWEVFYWFCNQIGVNYPKEQIELLDLWMQQSEHCHFWYPFENLVVYSERPTAIRINIRGELHSEDSLALGYSDGWGIYAINGVRLPAWIIKNPELITPELITSEKNGEIRRVMIGKYGWHNYLDKVKAELVDKHPDPTIGELWRWREPDGVDVQIIRCLNGTPDVETKGEKWYSLRVGLEHERAIDAHRWTYPAKRHLNDEDYLIWNSSRT